MNGEQHRTPAALELAAVLLLALASVATAWCGYQATRWNGEQAKAAASVSATRFEASRSADLANAQTQVDVATFVAWADAYARGDARLSDFYRARFRPEFAPAVEAWIATEPLQNPNAALTPFAMPEYRVAAAASADRLDAEAEALGAKARRNLQRASNYVLAVVLLSVALFFGGMSTKLGSQRLRVVVVALGCLLFVSAVAWVATFPVSVAV